MKWFLRILLGLSVLILVAGLILGFRNVPYEPQIEPENYGAGALTAEPAATGLDRAFPPLNQIAGREATPDSTELGKLLFFDPILSEANDISCASCHHPDYGFSDGQLAAVGAGGEGAGPERSGGIQLKRNTMTLWNVGYTQNLFWDGRAATLEEQVQTPLTHLDEMAVADIDALANELATIPEYEELFSKAFADSNGEAVSFANITIALADFQRSLQSKHSPFDAYAAGNKNALSPSQRRGLTLFRSAATRCFECHTAPTFSSETFRAIGVPSDDEGAGEGSFKVPTLRNVALTAPYMHNGSLASLEEVIDFYAEGGGRAHDLDGIDPFVLGFDLSEQEKEDLVNFLYALTDESQLPEMPEAVPSGLPIVASFENSARQRVAASNQVEAADTEETREPIIIRVAEGESVQAAVDRARPGDTVEIPFGVYNERVVVDINDLTILGVPSEAAELPIFDGEEKLSEAVISSGNNFRIGNIVVRNYLNNGILVEGVTGVHMHNIIAENTGIYGLYPVMSTDVLIEECSVSGANDAGIYAGQSRDIVIRGNAVYGNVLGIEAENTVNTEIYNNHAFNNTLGILVVLLPNLTSKVSKETKVFDNLVEGNNHENFGVVGLAAGVAPGIGIAVIGSDEVEVSNNTVRDNNTVGITVMHTSISVDADTIDVPSTPENVYVHGNTLLDNGGDPDPSIADMGLPGADLIWDASGANIRFDQPDASSFPPLLPTSRWSQFGYNLYWNALQLVLRIVG